MNARQVALIAVMSALAIVIAYSRGLAISSLPGVFEFMIVTERIRELVSNKSSIDVIRKAAMDRRAELEEQLAALRTPQKPA